MSSNVPSIQRIIDAWSDRYGNRFATGIRRPAIDELIQDFVAYGYDRSDIERSKAKITEEMVGPRTPYGASALKEWKIKVLKDFDKAVRSAFEQFEERTGPVNIPFTPKVVTQEEELEQERLELEQLKELNSLQPDRKTDKNNEPEPEYKYYKPNYDNKKPVIRPELDPLVRENVTASPIMSDEEFFAALERQKNE